MRDIFISYVEEDDKTAAELAGWLEQAGFSTWYYTRDGNVPGLSYLKTTRAAIEHCQAFILLISPNSVESDQVTAEVIRAHETKRPFIPLRLNINHDEFVERQPEWAQALGAATSISIPPAGVLAIAPNLLRGLRMLSVTPRPELVTNEMPVITPGMLGKLTGKLKKVVAPQSSPSASPGSTTTATATKEEIESASVAKARSHKKLYVIAAGAIALIVIGAWLTFFLLNRQPPLYKGNFSDNFDNLENWTRPAQGWSVGNNFLTIKSAPEIGYLTKERFGDFTMAFQVKMLNDQGAAWVLRLTKTNYLISKSASYYLFRLAGPGEMYNKNQFLAYRVRGADMEPVGVPFNLPPGVLKANGQYTISVRAEKGHFYHEMRLDDVPDLVTSDQILPGMTIKLGDHQDQEDIIPTGGIGFRTVRGEQFSIGSLFIYPPDVNPLADPAK
jgi:hypothetical protein